MPSQEFQCNWIESGLSFYFNMLIRVITVPAQRFKSLCDRQKIFLEFKRLRQSESRLTYELSEDFREISEDFWRFLKGLKLRCELSENAPAKDFNWTANKLLNLVLSIATPLPGLMARCSPGITGYKASNTHRGLWNFKKNRFSKQNRRNQCLTGKV